MSTTAYFPVPFHLQAANPAAAQQYAPVAYPTAYAGVYTLPQYQQAQQLFQKDAQIITPEAIENVKAALASSEVQQKADIKKRAIPCKAAGQAWEDPTLADWPEEMMDLYKRLGGKATLNYIEHAINIMISDYFVEILAMRLMMMFFQKLFQDIPLSTWQDNLEEFMNSKESWSFQKQYVDFLK